MAAEAINTGLLPQLKHGDALSIVLFDTRADVLLAMTRFEAIDQMDLKKNVAAMTTRVSLTLPSLSCDGLLVLVCCYVCRVVWVCVCVCVCKLLRDTGRHHADGGRHGSGGAAEVDA